MRPRGLQKDQGPVAIRRTNCGGRRLAPSHRATRELLGHTVDSSVSGFGLSPTHPPDCETADSPGKSSLIGMSALNLPTIHGLLRTRFPMTELSAQHSRCVSARVPRCRMRIAIGVEIDEVSAKKRPSVAKEGTRLPASADNSRWSSLFQACTLNPQPTHMDGRSFQL